LPSAQPAPAPAGAEPLPWWDRTRIAHETVLALMWLHGQQPSILHMDVKPDNILLDRCGGPRLGREASLFGTWAQQDTQDCTFAMAFSALRIQWCCKIRSTVEAIGISCQCWPLLHRHGMSSHLSHC
jgi:serine/threonine protein kinase